MGYRSPNAIVDKESLLRVLYHFSLHSFILGAYGIAEAAQAVLLVELGKAGAWNQANKQASKQCRPITSACLDEKGGADS